MNLPNVCIHLEHARTFQMRWLVTSAIAVSDDAFAPHHHNSHANTSCNGRHSNRLSPHENGARGQVLPVAVGNTSTFVEFVQHYRLAMRAHTDEARIMALKELRDQRGVWQWSEPGTSYGTTNFGDYINFKSHILHALESQVGMVADLWRPDMSLLDVGSGPGWLAAYLAASFNMSVVAFEVPGTSECSAFLRSPFLVNFFRSGSLPVAPLSYDAVSFMSVLHHAAEKQGHLLRQASAIARRWIVVLEDVDNVRNRAALHEHDPRGVFRTTDGWRAFLERHCKGFALASSGWLKRRRVWDQPCPSAAAPSPCFRVHEGTLPVVGMSAEDNAYLHFFVMERRGITTRPRIALDVRA